MNKNSITLKSVAALSRLKTGPKPSSKLREAINRLGFEDTSDAAFYQMMGRLEDLKLIKRKPIIGSGKRYETEHSLTSKGRKLLDFSVTIFN